MTKISTKYIIEDIEWLDTTKDEDKVMTVSLILSQHKTRFMKFSTIHEISRPVYRHDLLSLEIRGKIRSVFLESIEDNTKKIDDRFYWVCGTEFILFEMVNNESSRWWATEWAIEEYGFDTL